MANTTNGISVFAPAAIVALVILGKSRSARRAKVAAPLIAGKILTPPRTSIVPGGYIVSRLRLS